LSGLCITTLFSGFAFAQAYPTKTVTIVVPTAPGGANDAMARIVAQGLSQKLGQPVIVDNKPGANGAIATEFVARAIPDGHTILWGYIATHGINPALQRLKYDPIADFEPIGMVANSPTLLVTTNSLPVTNAKELVALLKAKPDSISYASAGIGTAPHLTAELFQINTGTRMLHVPYKGSAPALVDTIGGTTQVMFPSLFSAFPFVTGGKLRALGIAGEKRSSVLPNVPTLKEQGIPNMSVTQWYALFAPAKTPQSIIQKINAEVVKALNTTDVRERLVSMGSEPIGNSTDEFHAYVIQEFARWRNVIKENNIRAD
jgi:tripartite-type tricarboxylate transporter receptor subunit TctC